MRWRVSNMKNLMTVKYGFISLAFLTAGCSVTDYILPTVEDELNYTQTIKQTYQVDKNWWKLYNNAELNLLVETALKNNPDYVKAALNINKQLYNLNLATLDLFPTLYGNASASSQRQIDTKDNFSSNFSGEMGLNYELDLYGKIRDLQSAQEFEYQATIMDRESARLSLINSVVDLYFNLEYLDNSIEVAKDNVKTYQNIQDITELETQFKEMEASLKNILNTHDDKFTVKYGNILQQQNLNVDVNVPVAVLANRPDLKASELRLQEAFKNLNAEEKSWYPSVSINGLLASTSDKARTTFDFPYILGSVSVDLPFLDWNRVKNNINISKTDYHITLVDFNDTLNQAVNEVGYYYAAYEKSLMMFNNTEANYQNSVKITDYYKQRYNLGKIEFKDFLEAIYTQNALKQSLISQKYQIIKYENYVYKALGGKYQ